MAVDLYLWIRMMLTPQWNREKVRHLQSETKSILER